MVHLSTALLAMVPATYAHMILSSPNPYGKPTSSPLKADGSDFPCQNVDYTVNQMNNYKVGEQGTMQWSGSAVHGGGSCQIAISLTKKPAKDSKWKTIYSIEGGCPLSAIPFTIPKEVPNGEFSMAVTWFNHIGNREMYMNCAPVTISGGSDDTSAFDKLPDMAVANIAVGEGANCKTTEGADYAFENPGQYTTRIGPGPFKPLCGGATVPGQDGPGQPGQPSVKPPNDGKYTPPATQAPAPSQSSAPTSQAPAPVPTKAPSVPGFQGPELSAVPSAPGVVTSTVRTLLTVTATGNPRSSAPPAPVVPSQTGGGGKPSSTATPQPTGQPSTPGGGGMPSSTPTPQPTGPPSTPGGGSGGGGSEGAGTCNTDGAVLCNGDTQFGLCNHGTVVWQAVAPGTKCVNGEITRAKRAYSHRNQRSAI